MKDFNTKLREMYEALINRTIKLDADYNSYLSDIGKSGDSHVYGFIGHAKMKVANFGRAIEQAEWHESTVNNFNLEYNSIINDIDRIKFNGIGY